MAKRLKDLEKKYRLQEDELTSTKNELENVKRQLDRVTKNRDSISDKYDEIKQQIDEMEVFLSDYGLIWVGDSNDLPYQLMEDNSYDEFIKGLSKINESLLEFNLDSLPIYIYSNGVQLDSKPFRQFDEPELTEFITDVINGYFPSELYKSYHNGCTFEIFDRRNFPYTTNKIKSNIVEFSSLEDRNNYSGFTPLVFKSVKNPPNSFETTETKNNKIFLESLNSDQIVLKVRLKPPKPSKYLVFSKTDKLSHVIKTIHYECKLLPPLNIYASRIGKIESSEQTLKDIGITISTVIHIHENRKYN